MNLSVPKALRVLLLAVGGLCVAGSCVPAHQESVSLNDIHSRLNQTTVAEYREPRTKAEIVSLVRRAAETGRSVSLSGGRHSMGGQQFGEGTLHISLSRYNRVVAFDEQRGLVTVESGIQWPDLMAWLIDNQDGKPRPWGIRQKQSGADKISVGGSLSANAHGRGLSFKPLVADVEAFELIVAGGRTLRCSRLENRDLFGLAIGGYGLFGVITEVTLRLVPRIKVERKVELLKLDDLSGRVARRIEEGFLFGDFQFKTDESAADFLEVGVFSCYRPAAADAAVREDRKALTSRQWEDLYRLAHLDKARGFQVYAAHYLSTDGQVYWSDAHQMSDYIEGQDEIIDRATKARAPGSLMITELYVPRPRLPDFLRAAGARLRERKANLIYGTVRFIQKDDETFLPWARESFACVVMNLRVTHDDEGLRAAQLQFQDLIDVALSMGGSYFLTYHRWARKDQVLKAYPRFPEFLALKRRHDPDERFQSEWYRHYRKMFAE
jgi:FAD/FMN-containing dehydrogenase